MYRLLIVDDEPLIVDWLHRLFSGLTRFELDIYTAHTGNQAIAWLNRTKIDIVLTDIHMPEMNGMQLLDQIKARWPECKVIFLTGYDQFEYVYTAIKHESVSYLLKTEDDSEIIKAFEKAVEEIEKSFSNAELINKIRQQEFKALPLLQREYLNALLGGDLSVLPVTQQQLDEVDIPLKADLPVLLLLGRMNPLSRKLAQGEKNRLIYAAKNLVERYMYGKIRSAFLTHDISYTVWLIQPADPQVPWIQTCLFVRDTLESAQRACRESFKADLSFALAQSSIEWETVSEKYYCLKQLLNYRFGSGGSFIVTENEPDPDIHANGPHPNIQVQLNRIGKMESCLERGLRQEFFEAFAEFSCCLRSIRSMNSHVGMELYFSLSLKLLSFINRRGLLQKREFQTDIDRLIGIVSFDCWSDAVDYLEQTASSLFQMQEHEQLEREKDTVLMVQQYIWDHLAEDVSLVKLGELTYFNPTYLSRLFKQVTGTNISDHIHHARINKAKEYLSGTGMKIHEIAASIGFESPAYFSKFFKKAMNVTPQEYRDALVKK